MKTMNSRYYKITIEGCDDDTVFILPLTGGEAHLVRALCAKSREVSTHAPMPTMKIEEPPELNDTEPQ